MKQGEALGRISARRKADAVLRVLRGEDPEPVSQDLGVAATKLAQWRDAFLEGGKAALKSHASRRQDQEIEALKAMVGELTMRLAASKAVRRALSRLKPASARPSPRRRPSK